MAATATEVIFLELTAATLEQRLCTAIERFYLDGRKVQVLATDQSQAARFDDLLWTFRPDSFVPHELAPSTTHRPLAPVVITSSPSKISPCDHLVMTTCCEVEFLRQFVVGLHPVVVDRKERLQASRQFWLTLRQAGFRLRHRKLAPAEDRHL